MPSDERLRKEVIKEMKGKWREENPDMNIQEKRSTLSNYLLLFRSIPLKVKDRVREVLHRRSVAQAPTDIMHEDQKGLLKDLFDHVIKEGQGDHQQKTSNLDTQEHQGDLHQRLSHKDTQEHQGDVHQTTQEHENSHQDAQDDQGQFHENVFYQEMQEDQENLNQESSLKDTQRYQHLQEPLRQEDICQEDPRQDPQEDQKKLQQESSPQDKVEKD